MKTKTEMTTPQAFIGAAAMLLGIPVLLMGIGVPFALLSAWIRSTIWDWFCASFGLPHVGVAPMFIVGLFISTWHLTWSRELKDEHYKSTFWANYGAQVMCDFIALGIAFLIHSFWS